MYKTFNMGIGFVVIVRPSDAAMAREVLSRHYVTYELGTITDDGTVTAKLSNGNTIHF
jgi:phosphoribosylformylglycinamidine cyclo-ligase